MTEILLVQKLAYILAACLEGEWFLYFSSVLSFEKCELQMRTILSTFFQPLLAQTNSVKKF